MKSEHRSIFAIAISVAFMILWFTVINPPQNKPAAPDSGEVEEKKEAAPQDAAKKTEPVQAAPSGGKSPISDPQGSLPIKTWILKNDLVEADLTSDGAAPVSWKILNYRQGADEKSSLIDLVSGATGIEPPLTLRFTDANFLFPAKPRFELVEAGEQRAVFRWKSGEVEILKTISLNQDSYLADVNVEVKNLTKEALEGKAALDWTGLVIPPKKEGILGFLKQDPSSESKTPIFFMDGSVKRESGFSKTGESVALKGAVLWAGLESRYFLNAVIPRTQGEGLLAEYGAVEVSNAAKGSRGMWAGVALPKMSLPAGATAKLPFSVYCGPKEIEKLKGIGVKLEDAIDYGWFTVIAVPILYLLRFFYGLINNYGIAIILLTVFVKLLLHPINVKSLKSMKAMQQLQPKIKELQAKYKGDKQRLNQETMQLFRSHKVNPMGGCLPMLLQFPIYIALYKVLWNSIELYHAPFFWFYRDLSAPDPYFITPVLLGLFMVAQQKLTPSASTDPAQQKMMMLMPIMFSVFMLFLPVGLVVYILVNTVMSVTQQWMYNHDIPLRDIVRGRVTFKNLKAHLKS